jgi:hypothetical protein
MSRRLGLWRISEKKFGNLRRKFQRHPFDPVIAAQKRETIVKKRGVSR